MSGTSFSIDADCKVCSECGLVCDVEETSCENCGGKVQSLYVCPVCHRSYTRSNIEWHYKRHYPDATVLIN